MRFPVTKSAAACMVAVSLWLAGCGTDTNELSTSIPETVPAQESAPAPTEEVTRPPLPTAQSVDPDRSDPKAVLLGLCQIVFSRDTLSEKSYSSSYQRAESLMTPQLQATLVQPPKAGMRPFPLWVQWQRSQAWIVGDCSIAADEHPADTATSVSRVLRADEHPRTGGGAELDDETSAVWATATRTPKGWLVSRFDEQRVP